METLRSDTRLQIATHIVAAQLTQMSADETSVIRANNLVNWDKTQRKSLVADSLDIADLLIATHIETLGAPDVRK